MEPNRAGDNCKYCNLQFWLRVHSFQAVFSNFFVIFFVSPFYVLSVPSVKYSFFCNDYITVLVFIIRISLNSFLKLLVYVYNIQYVICITKY